MAGIKVEGASGTVVEVTAAQEMKVALPASGAGVGAIRFMSENDDGTATGTPLLLSPETDGDSRLRVAAETLFDTETLNYVGQNTGKHILRNTTLVASFSAAGLNTNSTNLTTTTTGQSFATWAEFPVWGATCLYCEVAGSFTGNPVTNTIIDFGLFRPNTANPYNPLDGAHFRLTSAGLLGIINHNGTETPTAPFAFTYDINRKYQFIIAMHERRVEFWIDGTLYGAIDVPAAQGQAVMSTSLPFAVRHAITGGAAGGVLAFVLNDYTISVGGPGLPGPMSILGQRKYGSYQGLSGGTMGSLAAYVNSALPTAAVPTNTTAALGTGLGGQFLETDTLAANTDGIICSYQLPAGSANVQGRRLVLQSVKIDSFVQTVLAGGGYNAVWALAFGHTAVSLATAEAATTKARRIVPLGANAVAANLAALTQLPTIFLDLGDAPVFVNPGEFIAITKKKVGAAPTSGAIFHLITLGYGWE